jgi:hypothetical protein
MIGLGSFVPPAYGTIPVNREIRISVLDNAIAIDNEGAISVFKDVTEAIPHLEKTVAGKLTKIKAALNPPAAKGIGALGGKDIAEFIDGISTALGLPKDAIKDRLKAQFGFDSWQTADDDSEDSK